MRESTKQSWATGGTIFAATMLLIIGIFQFFQGIAAIAADEFFLVTPGYAYQVDTTAWGWTHMIIGVIVAITGLALFTGMVWARILGIAIAGISALANFFFVPYYPLWSLLIIALDIFAIWAIATVRPAVPFGMEARAAYGGGAAAADYPQTGERWPSAAQPAGRHWATESRTGMAGRTGAEEQEAERAQQAGTAQEGYRGGMRPPGTPSGGGR